MGKGVEGNIMMVACSPGVNPTPGDVGWGWGGGGKVSLGVISSRGWLALKRLPRQYPRISLFEENRSEMRVEGGEIVKRWGRGGGDREVGAWRWGQIGGSEKIGAGR